MKIEVTDIARTFGRQTRAYAEYRIFSSLARFSDVVHEAAVSLTRTTSGHTVRCSVAVSFEMGRTVCVTARGRHPYDAISRVADRIGPVLRRHTQGALP